MYVRIFFLQLLFTLSKINTFASTAIPTVKITPAIPGNVKVAPIMVNNPKSINRLEIKAILATTPKDLYFKSIKNITSKNPTNNEIEPALIESSPKSGPTVLSSTIESGAGKAPDLKSKARSVAS